MNSTQSFKSFLPLSVSRHVSLLIRFTFFVLVVCVSLHFSGPYDYLITCSIELLPTRSHSSLVPMVILPAILLSMVRDSWSERIMYKLKEIRVTWDVLSIKESNVHSFHTGPYHFFTWVPVGRSFTTPTITLSPGRLRYRTRKR